ncbi:MAG: DNA polymerase IV [Kiritimatiellae bacterium]|nr:DNA polymerase IV [Kiritimatiellia bacterium]
MSQRSKRIILHVDMDAFFASVEQSLHPEWRGKPLIVGSGPNERGVVSTCSYEARKYGIHSAMPSRSAYMLCPHAIFTPPQMERYEKVSSEAFEVFNSFTPYVEGVSIDEAFLDITGSVKDYEDAERLGEELRKKVEEKCHVTCSVGIATNRLLAKIASEERKPNGLFKMPYEDEKIVEYLASKSVGVIWGIGAKTASQLACYGIKTCGDIQRISKECPGFLPESIVESAYGRADDKVYYEQTDEKSLSAEHTFSIDVSDLRIVREKLLELVSEVGFRFRKRERWAKTARIKIRETSFKTITRQMQFERPARDDFAFRKAALELFDALPPTNIRLIGFGVANIVQTPEEGELLLFDDGSSEKRIKRERLSAAIDLLREKGLFK